jgi:hypothetical protein
MKSLARIGLVLFLAVLAAPAYAGPSPVQRIILQEQAHKNGLRPHSPRPVAPAAGVSPAQRIITQENAKFRPPRISIHGAVPAVQVVGNGGFNWDDAGIGAAAALGLAIVATGAFLLRRGGLDMRRDVVGLAGRVRR